jgi:hypothetical protein
MVAKCNDRRCLSQWIRHRLDALMRKRSEPSASDSCETNGGHDNMSMDGGYKSNALKKGRVLVGRVMEERATEAELRCNHA